MLHELCLKQNNIMYLQMLNMCIYMVFVRNIASTREKINWIIYYSAVNVFYLNTNLQEKNEDKQ